MSKSTKPVRTQSHKATFEANADIALVKYWGKKDEVLRLPENGSISMMLADLTTKTTVEFQPSLTEDTVTINGDMEEGEQSRVVKHLDRIRQRAGITTKAKVVSENTFPRGTGLSSSSSGFAALTLAAAKAAGLRLTEPELSVLARQGSGSACRCVCGGFVEWLDGDTSDSSYSHTLFPADHWDIRDVVVVVDEGRKRVSSTAGHAAAHTGIFYQTRLAKINQKLSDVKAALAAKDFEKVGMLAEMEALEFHSILLTSQPPLIAWYPGTVEVMLAVQDLRAQGIPAYFTINTGFNLHVLTLPEHVKKVQQELNNLSLVKKTLTSKVGTGPQELSTHLF